MITGAQVLVDPIPRTPLPYGLLSVAQSPVDSDDHRWRGGIRFETDTCGPASITTDSCAATGTGNKTPTDTWITKMAMPFTVYTLPVCATVGNYDNYEARVVGALTAGEARAVEREFWTGEHGTLPHLASSDGVTGTGFDSTVIEQQAATIITGAPVSVTDGIALIEQALATCYGNEGVIHIPAAVLPHMMARGLARVDGARLRSPGGHLIAVGSGYPGTAPDGSGPTASTVTIYGTGAVTLRRSSVEVTSTPAQAVDRQKNDMILVAERTYAIAWDCCLFAQSVFTIGGTLVTE
jgi:hypothetical protein